MNKELREVYETIGEQKAKITVLEKENEQKYAFITLSIQSKEICNAPWIKPSN